MIPSFIGLITAQNVVLIKTRISLCITTKVGNKRILVIWCIGSVWTCADCATKITEMKTRNKQGIANWRSKGGHVYLLTLTNRHHRGDNLLDLLTGQQKALVKFWGQRAVKEMLKDLGYVGRVMATEVTWSFDNGWHPHFHILMFFEHELFNGGQGLRTFLANEWINACVKLA